MGSSQVTTSASESESASNAAVASSRLPVFTSGAKKIVGEFVLAAGAALMAGSICTYY